MRTTQGAQTRVQGQKLENQLFHKNCFFHNSGRNWGGLEVSRVTARTVRRQCNNCLRGLVLHGIEKSIVQHFPVNWHFKVLEMTLKTFHFVPGLSRTPLLFFPRYLTNIFLQNISLKKQISKNENQQNLKNRSWKVRWFVFARDGPVNENEI